MISETLARIRQLQQQLYTKLGFSAHKQPQLGCNGAPLHQPEMLLIGCVDARLDPHGDIGIEKGKALIYRNIAALVAPREGSLSVAAALEFAVGAMKVKRIVVMGHTACGGIRAYLDGAPTQAIRDYLSPLDKVHKEAIQKGETEEEQARDMERAAVMMSLQNLLSYDVVRDALKAGSLELQGWMLDTGNKLIWELDKASGEFRPLGLPTVK